MAEESREFPVATHVGWMTVDHFDLDAPVKVRNRDGDEFEAGRVTVTVRSDDETLVWAAGGPVARGTLDKASANLVLDGLNRQRLLDAPRGGDDRD